ncbi:hypothetical protein GCM10009651_35830 [Microbacterium natoriense]|uniref:hypothetical protein n=1 Tax=Microbacterium natoriense TaxID=284570 RepID=UPI0031E1A1E0
MSALVIPRFTVKCEECGSTITGVATREDADWFADQHNQDMHDPDVEIERQS